MKRIELIIFTTLVLTGAVAVFLPNTNAFEHVISDKQLLHEVSKEGRYISTDDIAQAIMENDPSYILVDIRSEEEYEKYTIDGAINIPFDKMMETENLPYFNQDVYTTVLFSNGSSLADQAWLRLRSYDYEGNKVLKDGVNEWYSTILNPQKPLDTDLSSEVYDQYLFRKGASIYFTGAQVVGDEEVQPKAKPTVKPLLLKKKKAVSGGCG